VRSCRSVRGTGCRVSLRPAPVSGPPGTPSWAGSRRACSVSTFVLRAVMCARFGCFVGTNRLGCVHMKRDRRLVVRVSSEEEAAVVSRASAAGLKVSEFVRGRVLEEAQGGSPGRLDAPSAASAGSGGTDVRRAVPASPRASGSVPPSRPGGQPHPAPVALRPVAVPRSCPSCDGEMAARMLPQQRSGLSVPVWVCPSCGTREKRES
jgi:hypothetical protein